jgi:hypothetical protein
MHNTAISYAKFVGTYMRITLDIPENLLIEAMKVTHTNTKPGVILGH